MSEPLIIRMGYDLAIDDFVIVFSRGDKMTKLQTVGSFTAAFSTECICWPNQEERCALDRKLVVPCAE